MWIVWIAIVFVALLILGSIKGSQIQQTVNEGVNSKLNEMGFNVSKSYDFNNFIDNKGNYYNKVRIDTNNEKLIFINDNTSSIENVKYKMVYFEDVLSCEIIEDNSTIQKAGVGRAIVGGAIAGGVGALVGAGTRKSRDVVNKLEIRVVIDDIQESLCMLNLINFETSRVKESYKTKLNLANDFYATMMTIIKKNNKSHEISKNLRESNSDVSYNHKGQDEVEKTLNSLKNLKEKGLITEQEYNEKRNIILDKIV